MPALDGLKVIDLTRVLAGPFCTMLLGDLGADVVKIEEPALGDDTRGWAPFIDGWSTYFLGVNRNKRSLALNLKSAEGAEVLARLIRQADVLVENLRPGTLARLGFGYEQAAALNPRLIYASVTGYGHTGPRRDEAGYDPVLQAESGLMDITGPADGEPSRVGVAMTDFLAGQFMFSSILVALAGARSDRSRAGHRHRALRRRPGGDDAAGRYRLRDRRLAAPHGQSASVDRALRDLPHRRRPGDGLCRQSEAVAPVL